MAEHTGDSLTEEQLRHAPQLRFEKNAAWRYIAQVIACSPTNDAERLAVDPARRAVVGRGSEKPAASTNTLALFVLAYNLGNFLRRLALPGSVQHWSLRSIQVKLIKIGAKVVRHARQVIFQRAEVAVSKQLFEQVLARSWALAPGAG